MQGQGDGGLAAVGATVQTLRPPRRRSFDLLAPLAVLVTWAYTMQTVGLRSGGCRAEAPGGALGTPALLRPGLHRAGRRAVSAVTEQGRTRYAFGAVGSLRAEAHTQEVAS